MTDWDEDKKPLRRLYTDKAQAVKAYSDPIGFNKLSLS